MNRLLFLLAACLLTGCQPDNSHSEPERENENESETPAPLSREEKQARSQKTATLLNEKRALLKDLQEVIAGAELDASQELEAIADSIQTVESEFTELYHNHPRLKKLNYELSLWQRNATSRPTTEAPLEGSNASAQIMKIRGEIRAISKSLPEFTALEGKISQLQEEADDLRRTLAALSPKGKEIIDRLEAIEAEISDL